MTDPVLIAIVGGFQAIATTAIVAWFNKKHSETTAAIEGVHKDVNGKMESLLKVTGEAERAKGNLEGHAEAAGVAGATEQK